MRYLGRNYEGRGTIIEISDIEADAMLRLHREDPKGESEEDYVDWFFWRLRLGDLSFMPQGEVVERPLYETPKN